MSIDLIIGLVLFLVPFGMMMHHILTTEGDTIKEHRQFLADLGYAAHGGWDMDDTHIGNCVVCGKELINPLYDTCKAHREEA